MNGFLINILSSAVWQTIWQTFTDTTFLEKMESSYSKAIEKYGKGKDINRRLISKEFPTWKKLAEYIQSGKIIESYIYSFIDIWENELRNDHITYQFLIENILKQHKVGIDSIQEDTQQNLNCIEEIRDISKRTEEKIDKVLLRKEVLTINLANQNITQKTYNQISLTLSDNGIEIPCYPVPDNFIVRTVSEGNEQFNILDYLNGKEKVRQTLLDYIIDHKNSNRLILFSEGHRGKTYELQYIASQLQETKIFIPYIYYVKNHIRVLTDKIPLKSLLAAGTKGVLIIDGLDEVKGSEKDALIREINKFGESFKGIILISCRSNFEEKSDFADYKRFMLDTLEFDTMSIYIKEHCKYPEKLLDQIDENDFYHLAYIPFYLRFMINQFNTNGTLFATKKEIYESIIQESVKEDIKRYPTKGINSSILKNNTYKNLIKIAFCLQTTEKNFFATNELIQNLGLTEDEIENCLYFTIFKKQDENYLFEHNIFKEHLVACELLKHPLSIIKELVCYPQTEKIRPNWFNTLILYMSYLDESNESYGEVITWFSKNGTDVIINADVNFLDEEERFQIMKNIVLQYKELKIGIDWNYETKLMRFANSGISTLFLLSELAAEEELSIYNRNILHMLESANWNQLTYDEQNHKEELFTFLKKHHKADQAQEYLLRPFNNSFFYNRETLDKIYEIIHDSTFPPLLNDFLELIFKADLCDKYADIIFSFQKHIRSFKKNGYTLKVDRTDLFNAFSGFKKAENIGKALIAFFNEDEDDNYFSIVRKERLPNHLVSKSIKLYNDGEISILRYVLDCVIVLAKNKYHHHHSANNTSEKTELLFRRFFYETGLSHTIYEEYLQKCRDSFCEYINPKTKRDSNLLEYNGYLVSLLLTKERCIKLLESLDKEDEMDYCFTTWLHPADDEVAEWFTDYCNSYFKNKPAYIRDYRKEQQQDFELIFDYERFKKAVNEIPFENPRKKGRKLYIKEDDFFRLGRNLSSFLHYFMKEEYFVDMVAAKKYLEDENKFKKFQFTQIGESLSDKTVYVSEEKKQRINELAHNFLETGITKPFGINRFRAFINMLFAIKFNLDESLLLKLVGYADYPVHLTTDDEYLGLPLNYSHNLLECLSAKIKNKSLLTEEVLSYLKSDIQYSDSFYEACCEYIIDNRINNQYPLLLWILNKKLTGKNKVHIQLNTICKLAEADKRSVSLIKKEIHNFDNRVILYFCRSITKYNESTYINKQIEDIYQNNTLEDEKELLLSVLINNASINGLNWCIDYLKENPKGFPHGFPQMNFNTPDIIYQVFQLYEISLNRGRDFGSMSSQVESQIEQIALINKECLSLIQATLKEIITKYNNFHYINRFIGELSNKYNEAHHESLSLKEAISFYDKIFS